MYKDTTKEYVTDAFRLYARLGKKSFEELKQTIYDDALGMAKKEAIRTNNICSPTEMEIMRAEQAVYETRAELEDILAVEKTLNKMNVLRGNAISKAIEIVYFTDPDNEIKKGDIEARVIHACNELHADRRTIYRWLALTRRTFCEERGLRVDGSTIYRVLKKVF